MSNTKKSPFKTFTGTVDSLLDHCTQIDTDRIGDENNILSPGEAVNFIMEEYHVSREQAEKIRMEIAMEQIKEVAEKAVEAGLLVVDHYDEELNPVYKPTEKGKKELNWK